MNQKPDHDAIAESVCGKSWLACNSDEREAIHDAIVDWWDNEIKTNKGTELPVYLMLQNTVMDGTASSGLLRPLLASSAFKNTNLGVLTQGSGNRGSGTAVRTIIHVGTDQSKR